MWLAVDAVGAPTKLTPARQKAICQAIELGATFEHAAAAAGIHYDTFASWRKNNSAFSEALKSAEANGVVKRLERIARAAVSGAWQADAWLLERRYPQEYGKQIVQHEGGQTLTVRFVNDWRGDGGVGGGAEASAVAGGAAPVIEAASGDSDAGA